jgi:hypothetical protein
MSNTIYEQGAPGQIAVTASAQEKQGHHITSDALICLISSAFYGAIV